MPQTTADGDALPGMGLQRTADDRFHIVASVEADQAGLNANAMFSEFGQSRRDRLGYRLGVPRPGHPIRIKPNNQDAW